MEHEKTKQMLKELRLDTEKWFDYIDSLIISERGEDDE